MRFWWVLLPFVLSACLPDWLANGSSDNDALGSEKPEPVYVDIGGTIRYQDRLYNQFGFINNNYPLKTVRNINIQLISSDGDVLANVETTPTGNYIMTSVPTGEHFLRLTAQTVHDSGATISIRDHQGDLYAVDMPVTIENADSELDVQLNISDRVAGIFNMLDVFHSGFDFIWDVSSQAIAPNDLNVYWQWGTAVGSYTCHAGSSCLIDSGIYVLSDPLYSGDTDEFDDDVLLHELAHHLEGSLLLFDSPGGMHSLQSLTLDLRLSWSEGFASFFAASVKHWLRINDAQRLSIPNSVGYNLADYYIDTVGQSVAVNLDLKQASTSIYKYATNEVAVASSLLALQNDAGFETTWVSIFQYLVSNSSADTLEAFWDGLVGLNSPSTLELSQWQATLANREINYFLDDHESDQTINSAQIIDESILTLYRNHYSPDTDWFQHSLTANETYHFSTYDLRNGADTVLALFYGDGSPILDGADQAIVNDDAFDCEDTPGGCSPLHDGTNFSSKIIYTPSVDETVYIRVTTSDWVYNDPASYGYIGRYGSYKISVESGL